MSAIAHQCKACGTQFTGKYCSNCGEKVYHEHDKSVWHLLEEGLHFFTHFEGTFFTTLKYIFTRPGMLSQRYCEGIRKSLFKPLSLFFLLVVIYLIFPFFEGLNMRLNYHASHNVYGHYAVSKILSVMHHNGWSDEQMAMLFHEKSAKISKFLLLILLPLTALFFWPLTFRRRPFFFDQMVFATEVNSVYLIWGFMVLPLLLALFEFIVHLFTGHYVPVGDNILGPIISFAVATYVAIAARRFYGLSKPKSILLALGFLIVHYIIVQLIYKFLLFIITINLLH